MKIMTSLRKSVFCLFSSKKIHNCDLDLSSFYYKIRMLLVLMVSITYSPLRIGVQEMKWSQVNHIKHQLDL